MLVLVFYLNDIMYLLKYHQIHEVLPMVLLKEVPHSPDYFAGFFNYRGTLVPVIDLRQLIHQSACVMRLSTRIILVEYQHDGKVYILGLMAERVTEAVRKPEEAFMKQALRFDDKAYFGDVIMEKDTLIQCLELDTLIEQCHTLNTLSALTSAEPSTKTD